MAIHVTINLDIEGKPTPSEQAILAALGGVNVQAATNSPDWPSQPEAFPIAPKAEPKPAKKAAAPKPKPAPEPEPDAAEDDAAEDGPSLSDAVKKATKMVSEGKSGEVKAALTSVGVKRVSELAGGQIAEFLAAVE